MEFLVIFAEMLFALAAVAVVCALVTMWRDHQVEKANEELQRQIEDITDGECPPPGFVYYETGTSAGFYNPETQEYRAVNKDLEAAARIRERVKGVGMPRGKR